MSLRKLKPTVLMVKSAQDVASDDAAAALNGPAMWGIFLQAEMVEATFEALMKPCSSADFLGTA